MNKPTHIKDELLINHLLGETTVSENEMVAQWLAESDENRAYYEQFTKVWEHSRELVNEVDIDEEQAWKRLEVRMKKGQQLSYRRTIMAVAASILFILGMFWVFTSDINPFKPEPILVKVDTAVIQTIESALATKITSLADESVITLNKKSTLKAPDRFIEKERRVALEGEAFFSITPDKEKPFIIETQADVEIRVVGTSFNVKSFQEYTEVIVETGVVELNKGNSSVRLVANEKARIYNQDSVIKVEKKTDDLYKYYRSKTFDCDNTPLWKVVEVLNEAYEEKIIIKDKSLRNMRLDTQFDNEDIEMVMEVLAETFEFTYTKRKNTYFITR